MKKFVAALMLICSFSNAAYAECDFSTGITTGPNKTYVYTEECHLKVGQLVQSNKTKDSQIADLTQAITLKDLALTKADSRISLWMDTSFKMEERLNKVNELRSKNETLYFVLGALTVIGAGMIVKRTLN